MMEMNKFTTGPWTQEVERFGLLVRGDDKSEVATVTRWYGSEAEQVEEYTANAKLIAAAPELLEALQAIIASECRQPMIGSAWVKAQKAIAKALA